VFGQKRFGAFGVVRNSVSSSDFAAGKDGVSASGVPTKPEWPLTTPGVKYLTYTLYLAIVGAWHTKTLARCHPRPKKTFAVA
jgi:hypothetical protein